MRRAPELLERVARAAAARPVPVLLAVAALALGGALLALGLQPSTDASTLASRDAQAYRATQALHERFGDDAVLVLVRQRVAKLVLTADLGRTIRLEGCLGGNVPKGAKPYGGGRSPCAELARLRPAKVVYGPGTFLNESVRTVQAAIREEYDAARGRIQATIDAARAQARAQGLSDVEVEQIVGQAAQAAKQAAEAELARLALSSGLKGIPQLDSKPFISQIVFDPARGADVPKSRFAYLFPSRDAALIQVRLRPDLDDAQRARAIELIRAATEMPMFASRNGGSYVVSGVPVVTGDLADRVTGEIALLLGVAVAAMALALLLAFRARLRLLPLGLALAAAGLTFGAMALAGAELTMASIAVLPILIGLAVDYAIQLHARVEEAREGGATGSEAVAHGIRAGAPTVATAALATAAGFLALLLSPVPMVRGFGVLLIAGVAIAFAVALTAGSAALAMRTPIGRVAAGRRLGRPAARDERSRRQDPPAAARELLRATTGAKELIADGAQAVLHASLRHPARILAAALAVAAIGWAADTQTRVVSDVRDLVPADMPALHDLDALQAATRSSGEIDLLVRGKDLARPAVVRWMSDYQERVLRRFGYDEQKGCATATLCPAFSLPDLFQGSSTRSRAAIEGLLDAVPPYFSSAVVTRDRTAATLAFGIRLMPLDEQQRVIQAMQEELDPPPGVDAQLAGVPVLAAQANADLSSSWRRLLTLLAGLLAVGLVLLLALRRVERALVPLIPIALATGWSALIVWISQVPLNPMSATLGALVIAISTEFGVLLSERFHQERRAGRELAEALARTYRSTGRAVLASGITAIAGFGVLALSDFQMLRDFGIVTLVDLAVSLLGVLAVLPSALVLAERGAFGRLAERLRRGRRRPTPRPPAPVA